MAGCTGKAAGIFVFWEATRTTSPVGTPLPSPVVRPGESGGEEACLLVAVSHVEALGVGLSPRDPDVRLRVSWAPRCPQARPSYGTPSPFLLTKEGFLSLASSSVIF